MSVRDLDEMRSFKNSEARLITRGEGGSSIDKIICDMGLKDLRQAHAAYIRGDAVSQEVLPTLLVGHTELGFAENKGIPSL